MTIFYVLIALLLFGVLIFVHELGHYLFARLFKVKINEFSIGMGPKIISKTSKKTGIAYSFRAFPVGGFVNMEGENEESGDTGAFCNKKPWQRLIITAAGSVTNIIIGFLVMTIIVVFAGRYFGTQVTAFRDNAVSCNYGLQTGDTIVKVNSIKVYNAYELIYNIMREGDEPIDLTVKRGEEKIVLSKVQFPQISEQGIAFGEYDFYVNEIDGGIGTVISQSFRRSILSIKMVTDSLADLLGGKYGFKQLSGPVGVTEAITTAAKSGIENTAFIFVVLAMNLGVFNLLPIPALDGGRVFFILIEIIFRKPVNRKIEAAIHSIGLIVLLLLMVVISFKDVINLF